MADPHDPDSMADLTSTYVRVIVLEAAIVALLWMFGRLFA